jgi:hypothetical protein
MADIASHEHLTDPTTFLQFFTSQFPPPGQNTCWHLCLLPNKIISKVFCTILNTHSTLEVWDQLTKHGADIGQLATPSSRHISLGHHPAFKTSHTALPQNCWLTLPTVFGPTEAALPASHSKPKQSLWRYQPYANLPNWMDNLQFWLDRKAAYGPTALPNSSKPIVAKTLRHTQH